MRRHAGGEARGVDERARGREGSRRGERMSVVAFVTDSAAIGKILDHLGLSNPEAEEPLPLREILRAAEHADGCGVPQEWD